MGSPDYDSGFWFLGNWVQIGRGVSWRTITDEWPIIQAIIDSQKLAPLALVTVSSYNPGDLGKCHQVLAYAYEVDDANQLTLHLYDPNTFPTEADGVHLKLSLANPTHTVQIDHNVNMQEPNIRGFFHVPYTFADPLSLEPVPPPDSNALFVGQRSPGVPLVPGQPVLPGFPGQPPVPLVPGQPVSVQVVMQNLGTTTWTPSGADCFRPGSQNPQDNTGWGTARVDLQGDVAPGAAATFDFDITAPATPGTYNFQWRMVQEMVNWFGDSTPNIPVDVQPALPTMKVSVQPYPVPLVKPVSVTISSFDAVTSAPLAGSVLLDGAPVGTTGTAFSMTIPVEPFFDPEKRKWTEIP